MRKMFKEKRKQYAEDCKNYERPWELWEYKAIGVETWKPLSGEPIWHADCIYRRKQTTFVPKYYSGLNWRIAEHLIGKTVEYTDSPDYGWKSGQLKITVAHKNGYHFGVNICGQTDFYNYIRTCEETFKHPTINICGVELPKPETVAPEPGTVYWVFRNTATDRDGRLYYSGIWSKYVSKWEEESLKNGAIHLTEERAKAWADWWKTTVIDKMK
jgi:hypothetical protein